MLAAHLDRLESILAQKDGEVRRLKTELDLRQLYINELHTILNRQTHQLQDLDHRIRKLEPSRVASPTLTTRIRIKKAF